MAFNRENLRASFALERVQTLNQGQKEKCKKIPSLIRNNGLIAAMAYLKKDCADLHNVIAIWLDKNKLVALSGDSEGQKSKVFLTSLVQMEDMTTYRACTLESLKLADWLKRMAMVEISD